MNYNGHLRILIVDDEPSTYDELARALRQQDYVVEFARSTATAQLEVPDAFDILLVDLNIDHNHDDFELIKAFKHRNNRLKILLVTKENTGSTVIQALQEYEVNDVLIKQEYDLPRWLEKIGKPVKNIVLWFDYTDKGLAHRLRQELGVKIRKYQCVFHEAGIGHNYTSVFSTLMDADYVIPILSRSFTEEPHRLHQSLNAIYNNKRGIRVLPIVIEPCEVPPIIALNDDPCTFYVKDAVDQRVRGIQQELQPDFVYEQVLSSKEQLRFVFDFEEIYEGLNNCINWLVKAMEGPGPDARS